MLTYVTDYLLKQSTQIALLFVLITAVCFILRKKTAHLRYMLWLIILAKCLIPSVITISLAILPEKPQEITPVVKDKAAVINVPDENITYSVIETNQQPEPIRTNPLIEYLRQLSIKGWMAITWLAGFILFMLIAAIKALKLNITLRQQRIQINDNIGELISSLASQFRIRPRAYLVKGIGQPFVWGFFRGSIYLPANFRDLSDSNRRKQILMHEIAHVLRFDAMVNILQTIAQGIFWFHPLVWCANKCIRAEREKCCDEITISRLNASPRDYGSAIVDTLVREYESTIPIPTTAIAGPLRNIEDRIKTIMKPGKKFYNRPTLIAIFAIFVLAVIVVPTTIAITNRRDNDNKEVVSNEIEPEEIYVETEEAEDSATIQEPMAAMEPVSSVDNELIEFTNNFRTAKIQIENPIYDFGVIGPGEKYTALFQFINVGENTLCITKIQSTCACSVGKLDKMEYAPGESGSVEVTYTAQSYEGSVSKKLYILSNDEENPRAEIVIKAKIELKVDVAPNKIVLLLDEDNAGMPEITLTSKDGQPFAVSNFYSTKQVITAEYDPQEQKNEIILSPEVNMEFLKENLIGSISIELTHPLTKKISINYTAIPFFELSGTGQRIIMKNAEPGEAETREVWIKSNYGREIEIESITSKNGCIKVVSREEFEKQVKLTVEFTTPRQTSDSKRFFTDELTIEIKDSPSLKIQCSGWYKGTQNNKISVEVRILEVNERVLEDIGFNIELEKHESKEEVDIAIVQKNLDGLQNEEIRKNICEVLLDDLQVAFIIRSAQKDVDSKLLTAPRVTVLNGESATLEVKRDEVFTSGYIESDFSDEPIPQKETVSTGLYFDILPEITDNGKNIHMIVDFNYTDITGYLDQIYRDKYIYKLPTIETIDISSEITLPDSQTSLLGAIPLHSEILKDSVEPDSNNVKRIMLILIKPTIVEPIESSAPAKSQQEMVVPIPGVFDGSMGRGFGGTRN